MTGAAGFVASHLVPALEGSGHEVFALARPDQAGELPGGSPVPVDLRSPLADAGLPAVDAVVHLAQANVPFPDGANALYRVNTAATQELLDHARRTGAQRFVFTSSGSVYGFGDRVSTEESELAGADFYSTTKIHAERLVALYREFFGTTVLRLFMPYGPGQRGRLVPALIGRVERGDAVTLNGGGQPRSNPTYIDDVVRVITGALESDGHQTLNVAGDDVAGIRELAEHIGAALGREPVFETRSPDGPGDLLADNARMRELLGGGTLVGLADGLGRAVAATVPAA